MEDFKQYCKKNQNPSSIPKYFIDENNKKVTNINEIANGFNDFFANTGPKLANKIKTPDPNKTIYDYLPNSMEKTIFLQPVTQDEVTNTIKTFKSKTYKDCDDVDMSIVKRLSTSVTKPLTHIFNLSFSSGVFPENMKIAKILPLLSQLS